MVVWKETSNINDPKCDNCGFDLTDKSQFCVNCGHTTKPLSERREFNPEAAPKRISKRLAKFPAMRGIVYVRCRVTYPTGEREVIDEGTLRSRKKSRTITKVEKKKIKKKFGEEGVFVELDLSEWQEVQCDN